MSRSVITFFVFAVLSKVLIGATPFFWGVSNSAFQVEGSLTDSDWARWSKIPGKIRDGTNPDRTCDFWNRYQEDFTAAKKAGLNAFRISIAWDRIEPSRGKWDARALDHYEKILVAMRASGLEPIVTLHHFVLPTWISENGGVLSPEFVDAFSSYAEKVVKRLSLGPARVSWWLTINEPMVLVWEGYLVGEWPPEIRDPDRAMKAAAQLARAHISAVKKMRGISSSLKIGFAHHWELFESEGWNPFSYVTVRILRWIFHHQFVDAVHTGKLFFWMPGVSPIREKIPLPNGRSTLDFLGINVYGRWLVRFILRSPYYEFIEKDGEKRDRSLVSWKGWGIYPRSMYESISQAARYGLPIFITENGIADSSDRFRPEFLKGYIRSMMQARDDGFDVIGYLYWSLTDNFEWANGLSMRFGLMEMDYNRRVRKPRPSLKVYSDIVHSASP